MNTGRSITRLTFGGAALVLLVAVGCTNEQRRSLGEVDVQEALAGRVELAVAGRGMELDGVLDCSSEIAADGAVSGSCAGITTSGAPAIGTFDGTGDVEAGTCSASLVIDVDAEVAVDEPDVDCFAVD